MSLQNPLPHRSSPRARRISTRELSLGFVVLVMLGVALTGFAPFHASGLARFDVFGGVGSASDSSEVDGRVESETFFHTLSSRFGGGGVLVYAEFSPRPLGRSGALLIDVRHAGLPDLTESVIEVPNRKRVEIIYQEWDSRGDLFRSSAVRGEVVVRDIYRGNDISAIALRYRLEVQGPGEDGIMGTNDDQWRTIDGVATTAPNVDEALAKEGATGLRSVRHSTGPDGDIYVSCFGDAEIEEETYEEDSFAYEDDSSCSGDTWEDDAEEPQDESGCAGKQVADEGEADPGGGCDGDGTDDIEDPESEDEGLFYDEESDTDDTEGDLSCDSDDDSDTGSVVDDTESDDDDDSGPSCEGDDDDDSDALAFAAGRGVHDMNAMRRYLDRVASDQPMISAPKPRKRRGRFAQSTWRHIRKSLSYLPFVLLAIGIRVWRRRMEAHTPWIRRV